MTMENMGMEGKFVGALSVVDFGLGLPAALVMRMLADMGARIQRFELAAGDPFYEFYPAYALWRRGAEISKSETIAGAIAAAAEVLAAADVCLIGGEDFPGIDWTVAAEEMARSYPRLVVLSIGGYVHGTPEAGAPSVDLFAQAYSGLVHEQYADRPMVFAMPAPSYGAALQGMVGMWAALVNRERTGKGQVVYTSLIEGTMSWLGHSWFLSERSDVSMDLYTPKGARSLIFRCKDGKYLHFALVTANARTHVYNILGIEDDSLSDPYGGQPSLAKGAKNFYGDAELLQSYIINWNRADLLDKLWSFGLAAEPVNRPGQAWDDGQVVHNGTIWREADGVRRVGLPYRISANDVPQPRRLHKTADAAPPLKNLRIVDFGTFAAGPHASMILSDLGADVIKVEALNGDPVRRFYRPYSTSSRGKRSLAVDLKKPEGLEIAHKLAARADMIFHNFRPGVTKRLGIDTEALLRTNASLILLENSGYGASGPKSQRAGIDFPLQAFCGHEEHAAGESGEFTCYIVAAIDFAAGMIGALSALTAQFRKERTGDGATVQTSLLDSALFLLSEVVQAADGDFFPLPKLNQAQTGFHPAEQLYKAQDGWIAIAARSEAMAKNLLVALGLDKKITKRRREWGTVESELIGQAVARHDAESALALLRTAEVWAVACRENAKEIILRDRLLRENGTVVATQHLRYGEILQIGRLFSFSRSATCPRGDTANLGQHSREVLAELGYSEAEITKLYGDGVVAG
jgi:crotonobetainyl-CoA:carnitine CoA-transferase CaiB-like acyl-CoA transferase